MPEPTTVEKHGDRLNRLEDSLKGALESVENIVTAFERENVSGDRLKAIAAARAKIDAAAKKFRSLKKD